MEAPVTSRLAYRADLDGLRALAVVPVVLYHLETGFLPGGFVGVDVFFVLSGFLITSLLAKDLAQGQFSLLDFYDRRIRRIVPALVLVLAFITSAALLILLPHQLMYFGTTLAATGLAVSNILFADAYVGYFSPDADLEPLLHTWTLAVEEQFYIFFPIVLWAVWHWSGKWLPLLVWSALALSLALSIWGVWAKPIPTFYLLPTRAWEFLVGSVLALRLIPNAGAAWQREAGAACGVLAIVAAMVLFTDETPFPGLAALLPCIGTALVIWAGLDRRVRETWTAALLGTGVPVFIGLISYSLYLWHWPLIVFAKHLTTQPLTPLLQLSLAAAAVACAALSWRYVERPLRAGGWPWPARRDRFVSAGVLLLAFVLAGVGIRLSGGLPQRIAQPVVDLAAKSQDYSPLRARCQAEELSEWTLARTCVLGASVPPSVIVLADSHGAELSAALGESAKVRGTAIRQITASGCPPAVGLLTETKPDCTRFVEVMLRDLADVPKATVVIAAHSFRWSTIDESGSYWPGLEATVRSLRAAGHAVVLLGAVPSHPGRISVPNRLARWVQRGMKAEEYRFPLDSGVASDIDENLARIARQTGATYVPLAPYLCPDASGCRAYKGGIALYFDDQHLSLTAARHVVRDILAPVIWPTP